VVAVAVTLLVAATYVVAVAAVLAGILQAQVLCLGITAIQLP